MPLSPQLTDFMSCQICFYPFSFQRKPVTLICSHTCCLSCLKSIPNCPFDQTAININLPENEAILGLLPTNGSGAPGLSVEPLPSNKDLLRDYYGVTREEVVDYLKSIESIKQLALLLKPNQSQSNGSLSRPMQRKLISLLHCQLVEGEGRSRAIRNVRSIGERALSEFLIKHQDPHTLSANLWAAVRARGCQFLGPAMQEEVLRLVLLALEDGSALSRKVLVMFVVQRLSPHFPHQASKTAIGHVIQLLYRASCFKLTKRDGDSSLMQLKEEYCSYEALRREHDTQIVSIALEAGLRISPDQWSSLLYGDTAHKSHMQSIIDKLQSPQSFSQSIQELVIALQRTGDPANLSPLREHFERLAHIDASPDPSTPPTHAELASFLESSKLVTFQLVDFLQHFGTGIYRTNRSNSVGAASKARVGRIKPFVTQKPQTAPQQISPHHQLHSPLLGFIESSSQFRFPKNRGQSRPCASVQPTRIAGSFVSVLPPSPTLSSPGASPLTHVAVDLAPSPLMGLPVIGTGDPGNATHGAIQVAVPAILVGRAGTLITPQQMCGQGLGQMTGSPLQPEEVLGQPQVVDLVAGSSQPCLPSEEDQFIPFADRPFVSKYGPISRTMSLINTPTIVGPGSALHQHQHQHRSNGNTVGSNSTGTHSTNVVLGRSAVPSLTLIQPLQQLVLTATTLLTEPPQHQHQHQFHHNSASISALIPDPLSLQTNVDAREFFPATSRA